MSPHTRVRTRVITALGLTIAAAWLLRLVTSWADHDAAALSFVAFLAAAILLSDWLAVAIGPGLWRFVRSVAVSVWRALRTDAEVDALVRHHPGLFGWLGRRLSTERATGLYLTVLTLSALYFVTEFLSIALSLVLSRAIVRYDPQILALLRAFRTPDLTRLFWIATLAADSRVIAVIAVAAVLLLYAWGRRSDAGLLAITLAVGLIAQTSLKDLFDRQRPPAAYALVETPASASFPSGHALISLLFVGVIVFAVWRAVPRLRARLAALSIAALAVITIGVSRMYLGVHWPSDVIASWSLATAILIVTCGGYVMLVRYRGLAETWPAWATTPVRWTATALVTAAVCLTVVGGALSDPLLSRATAAPPPEVWAVRVGTDGMIAPTERQARQLPSFSEKLDGTHQEPIGLVFLGTQDQLVAAFRAAGWQVADRPSLGTLVRTAVAAVRNRPYPTAPVTPSFLDGAVQDVAFEKSEGAATVRRRHHARFWQTGLRADGIPVWVATASFDSRLEIGSAIPLPTHHIDPDIDAEQAYIVRDLVATRHVDYRGKVHVTPPTAGTNAQGDTWFTRGYASILQAVR